ncbi:MAG: hypothetical protein LBD88_04720 [Candidatus Peribacteria bacterium]|jgi:hypothetical protein|nr:hypothetical protein [Candidatus Peribacteria bacterium]
MLKIYCKSSPRNSFFVLFVPANPHQKNDSKISHKSKSTHENPQENGDPFQEVVQNISYCFLFSSSDKIA